MRMGFYILLVLLFGFLTAIFFDLLRQLSEEYAKLHAAGVKEIELKIDVKGKR